MLAETLAPLRVLKGRPITLDTHVLNEIRCVTLDLLTNVRARAFIAGLPSYLERVTTEEPPINNDGGYRLVQSLTTMEDWAALVVPRSEFVDDNPFLHAEEYVVLRQMLDMADQGMFRTPEENASVRDLMHAIDGFRCGFFSNGEIRTRRLHGDFGGVWQYPPVMQHFHYAL